MLAGLFLPDSPLSSHPGYCGVPYDGLWMNWYRDHRDGTSWHADRPANLPQTAIVPALSLGATRRFLIRPNTGGPSTTFIPVGGDVLIMRGRCQRDWQHSVPKQQAPAGPRMSVNFSSSTQAKTQQPYEAPSHRRGSASSAARS